MTPQDWKDIEEKLKSFYEQVNLVCDGYRLTLKLERISQFKNAIVPYVNGKLDLKWLTEESEERRRFYKPVQSSVYSKQQKAAVKKMSKKRRKEMGLPDSDEKRVAYYMPYWQSFRSLKNHLIKNNQVVELLEE